MQEATNISMTIHRICLLSGVWRWQNNIPAAVTEVPREEIFLTTKIWPDDFGWERVFALSLLTEIRLVVAFLIDHGLGFHECWTSLVLSAFAAFVRAFQGDFPAHLEFATPDKVCVSLQRPTNPDPQASCLAGCFSFSRAPLLPLAP